MIVIRMSWPKRIDWLTLRDRISIQIVFHFRLGASFPLSFARRLLLLAVGPALRFGQLLEFVSRIPEHPVEHAAARVIAHRVAFIRQMEHLFDQFQGPFQAMIRHFSQVTPLSGNQRGAETAAVRYLV